MLKRNCRTGFILETRSNFTFWSIYLLESRNKGNKAPVTQAQRPVRHSMVVRENQYSRPVAEGWWQLKTIPGHTDRPPSFPSNQPVPREKMCIPQPVHINLHAAAFVTRFSISSLHHTKFHCCSAKTEWVFAGKSAGKRTISRFMVQLLYSWKRSLVPLRWRLWTLFWWVKFCV